MYDYSWAKNLVLSEDFDVFPLQFVNTKRIEKKNCIFIFDAVGCGKTISAGLMALHYLYNNPNKDVQIITINSLVRPIPGRTYGQFLNDWYEKLPFSALGMENRIHICNNLIYGIKNVKKTGLLIVDEAHLFLEDSQRTSDLKNIEAEKIVFLTATPIKHNSSEDFAKYTEIAKEVTGECPIDWIDSVRNEEPVICSAFDMESPVSRYFKDTVTALDYVNSDGDISFEKKKAKRLIPEIWEFENNNKIDALIQGIIKKKEENSGIKNRYVIFTRFIEKEANAIYDRMVNQSKDFAKWEGCAEPNRLTVVNLNGKSAERPTLYSHNGVNKELPDILIITYQIAEQGLNLPGYNYVINYHIPAFPSSLEQRFGRIDRMGKKNPSQYEEINMVFLISKDGWETYKINFYKAVSIYRNSLITDIPAKNVILTKEILKRFNDDQIIIRNYIEEIKSLLKTNCLKDTYEYLKNCNQKDLDRIDNSYEMEEKNLQDEKEPENMLTIFCVENELYLSTEEDIEELKTRIEDELKKAYQPLLVSSKDKAEQNVEIDDIIDRVGDKIYYFDKNRELHIMDPIKGEGACAELISKYKDYKDYLKEFYEQIKIPKLVEKYSEQFQKDFEEKFEEEFNKESGSLTNILMSSDEYKTLFEEKFEKEWSDILESDTDRTMLCEHADVVVKSLPFFKMVRKFSEVIHGYLRTSKDFTRYIYGYSVPDESVYKMKYLQELPVIIEHNAFDENGKIKRLFFVNEEGNTFKASNWFQLFYYCEDNCADLFLEFVYKYKELCKYIEQKECCIDEKAKKKVSELVNVMKKINYRKNHSVGLFEIFFAPKGGKNGEWRKPYQGGKKWSNLLPKKSYGMGYQQCWSMPNEKEADFFTYMIFSEIGAGAVDGNRTITKEWWLNSFIPNRCHCDGDAGKMVRAVVEEIIKKIML